MQNNDKNIPDAEIRGTELLAGFLEDKNAKEIQEEASIFLTNLEKIINSNESIQIESIKAFKKAFKRKIRYITHYKKREEFTVLVASLIWKNRDILKFVEEEKSENSFKMLGDKAKELESSCGVTSEESFLMMLDGVRSAEDIQYLLKTDLFKVIIKNEKRLISLLISGRDNFDKLLFLHREYEDFLIDRGISFNMLQSFLKYNNKLELKTKLEILTNLASEHLKNILTGNAIRLAFEYGSSQELEKKIEMLNRHPDFTKKLTSQSIGLILHYGDTDLLNSKIEVLNSPEFSYFRDTLVGNALGLIMEVGDIEEFRSGLIALNKSTDFRNKLTANAIAVVMHSNGATRLDEKIKVLDDPTFSYYKKHLSGMALANAISSRTVVEFRKKLLTLNKNPEFRNRLVGHSLGLALRDNSADRLQNKLDILKRPEFIFYKEKLEGITLGYALASGSSKDFKIKLQALEAYPEIRERLSGQFLGLALYSGSGEKFENIISRVDALQRKIETLELGDIYINIFIKNLLRLMFRSVKIDKELILQNLESFDFKECLLNFLTITQGQVNNTKELKEYLITKNVNIPILRQCIISLFSGRMILDKKQYAALRRVFSGMEKGMYSNRNKSLGLSMEFGEINLDIFNPFGEKMGSVELVRSGVAEWFQGRGVSITTEEIADIVANLKTVVNGFGGELDISKLFDESFKKMQKNGLTKGANEFKLFLIDPMEVIAN